jgi:dihydrofolate reductase
VQTSVFIGVSIDGFIAHVDGSLDFLKPFESGDNGYEDFFRTIDTLVVGRGTYETVLGFDRWPWDGKRVVVLTHRPIEAKHGETTYAGSLAPLVKRLASEGAKRVYLDGGNAIRQALDEDIIDDMAINVVPRTIGAGRPLFGPIASVTRAWRVAGVRQFPNGIVQTRYERDT